MSASKIEWTDETWNPVTGCSKVSPGCENCYAERQALGRLKGTKGYPGLPWTKANAGVNVQPHPSRLEIPLRAKRPRRYFVNSMSDLFHEEVPDEFLDRIFAVMALTPRHTYQVLTKRAARMREYISSAYRRVRFDVEEGTVSSLYWDTLSNREKVMLQKRWWTPLPPKKWPLRNVWLGVSAEDQRRTDERVPHLLATPSAVRFVSAEPLLGPVDVSRFMWPTHWHWDAKFKTPKEAIAVGARAERKRQALVSAMRPFVDWIIVGGESGPHSRPMDVEWARDIVRQCGESGVPVFVKQMGARPITTGEWTPRPRSYERVDPDGCAHRHYVSLRDAKGGDPSEWPEDLRVQQMPESASVEEPV